MRQTFGHVQEKTENFFHFQKTESVIIVVWRFRVCMKKKNPLEFCFDITRIEEIYRFYYVGTSSWEGENLWYKNKLITI